VSRRQRSAQRKATAFVAQIIVGLVRLAFMLGIVIPWAGRELTESAQEQFGPSATPAVSITPGER
jgi:hypothetical protein